MIEILKLLAIFVLIVVLLRRRVNLGFTMLGAALLLGLVFGLTPRTMAEVGLSSVVEPGTVNLLVVLSLIMVLENIMRTTGMMTRMTQNLTHVVGDQRVVMAMLPAFLGFLPSAGGARFSAPMVEEAARQSGMSDERKAFVNYWFRHIWEFTWPLYPSLILTAEILDVPVQQVVGALVPFTVLAIAIGVPFAFLGIRRTSGLAPDGGRGTAVGPLLLNASPILATVLLVLGMRLDVVYALLIVVAALFAAHRYRPGRMVQTVRRAVSLNLLALVLGVMVFKGMLVASGATQSVPQALASLGVGSLLVIFLVPFFIGVATGFAQAPVAIGFPILSGLFVAGGQADLNLIVVGFVAGFAGVMLSPAHLCLVLTADHFRTDMALILRRSLLPELVIIGVALLYGVAPLAALALAASVVIASLAAQAVMRLVHGRVPAPAATRDSEAARLPRP